MFVTIITYTYPRNEGDLMNIRHMMTWGNISLNHLSGGCINGILHQKYK